MKTPACHSHVLPCLLRSARPDPCLLRCLLCFHTFCLLPLLCVFR